MMAMSDCLYCVHFDRVERIGGILTAYCDIGPECVFQQKLTGNVIVMAEQPGGEELQDMMKGCGDVSARKKLYHRLLPDW